MADLDIAAQIQAPDGWHDLDDEDNGRELHPDSFASRTTTRRNVTVDGDWVDGSFTKRSTRGNVVETVAVWVDGATPFEFATRMAETKSWFDQLDYQMKVRFGDAQETWHCVAPGEYTEDLQQPYRFAVTGLLRVQLARLPAVVLESV